MTGMHMMSSTSMGAGMGAASVPMMLPSAVPALVRRTRDRDGVLAAPLFAGSYLAVWALVGLAVYAWYRPPGPLTAGALVVAAGLYELTPLKRECRRRCREHTRSGLCFGVYCLGSSIGLMLILVALNVMSIPLMCLIAVAVLAQKLLPPHPAVDVPLALTIVVLGIAVAAT